MNRSHNLAEDGNIENEKLGFDWGQLGWPLGSLGHLSVRIDLVALI